MKWISFVGYAAGAWLVVSPWVLGFSEFNLAMWNSVLVGGVIILMTLWRNTLAGGEEEN